mgnify:CR=1 FL=1|jgi:uncharacterized protein
MTHTPHELAEEFPEHTARLHELKLSNAHFRHLSDEYHKVNREIHRIESETEAASDAVWEGLKKQRLALADQIRDMLAAPVSG